MDIKELKGNLKFIEVKCGQISHELNKRKDPCGSYLTEKLLKLNVALAWMIAEVKR